MGKLTLYSIYSVLSLLLLTGCQKDFFHGADGDLLRFSCDSIATRSAGYTQSGQSAILSMGVYAAHSDGDWNGTSPLNFMQDRKVERSGADSPWDYSPDAYWPGSGKISFFAYAPYNAAGLTRSGVEGVPQIEFTVAGAHDKQVDLLTAIPMKNQTKSSSIGGYTSFVLRHALTRISFAAKTSVATTDTISITAITINNLYHRGSSWMDATNRVWTPLGDATATYPLSSATGGGLKDVQLTADYQTITEADGNLFLLPQILQDAAQLVIAYTNNGAAGTPVTIKLSDILAQWQPGEALRFLINLETSDPTKPFDVEMSYTFVSWDNHSTDVEINQDPFLYVTDVSTSSYDAAVTRLYFYTNEPTALVFIDPIGRVSSLSGATVNVKDEFHALAKDDPDGTVNFFFDETTHQGWIDLINRNTTTAGAKQPLIIKLCAGKLQRYITVQPVISTEAASQNMTPYIGTFHRHNEMGERIVTWHVNSDVSWTATIDNTVGNYQDLVLDRMASPDYKDNLLYSLVPRKAEGAKVEPHTSVSGKGRLYFRVGWKNTSSANRYARIKVVYSGVNPPASHDIYCRQGEETDYLLPNTTADDFTVYNLAGDGIFVDYPTQGGLLSQWGRPRLWPLIGERPPAGYPVDENTQDLDPDINICPERFTYLNATAISEIKNVLTQLSPKWGYYADGFFDRRSITSHRVDNASINVASAGILLSVESNLHSFFVPTVGYRDEVGWLKGTGSIGGYWAGYQESAGSKNAIAIKVFDGFTANDITGYDKRNSFFLRCIRIRNAVVLSFDPNGGDNAPRSVSGKQNEPLRIPSKQPDEYWKDNYAFAGWTIDKNGTGTVYAPGSSFQMGNTDQILYAKWIPDFYRINFRKVLSESDQTRYLTTSSYKDYTISSNGVKLTSSSYYGQGEIYLAAEKEPAYGNLEYHQELRNDTWSGAYNYCKGLDGGDKGWRLPRIVELLLVANLTNKDITSAIFGSGIVRLWSGTEYNQNDQAYTVLSSIVGSPQNKTTSFPCRCVREVNQ